MHRHPARPWPRRREIARRLGRLPSTVSRELRRNLRPHDREIYDGDLAHARARDRARRPLLAPGPELRRTVHNKLHLEWSPAHLAAHRIRIGDWEGHRIVGRMSRSAIGTLVDRRTGFLRLVYLPDGHGVEQLRVATLPVLTGLPVLAGRC